MYVGYHAGGARFQGRCMECLHVGEVRGIGCASNCFRIFPAGYVDWNLEIAMSLGTGADILSDTASMRQPQEQKMAPTDFYGILYLTQ